MFRCILSKFYIKPQPGCGSACSSAGCILSKFYIKPQRYGEYMCHQFGCILSKFYIKPQPVAVVIVIGWKLYLIEILHQTTTSLRTTTKTSWLYLIEILHQTTTEKNLKLFRKSCILSKFYIKPQRQKDDYVRIAVVSYRNSTSNHNRKFDLPHALLVVSYRNSTSNHNRCPTSPSD